MTSPAAQSPVIELIFSYLLYHDLISCRASCKYWREITDLPNMHWLWKPSYRAIVSSPRLQSSKDINWLCKCRDIFQVAQGKQNQFFIEDFAKTMQLPPIGRLTCRAGHSATLVRSVGRDFVLLFAGASHFFNFTSTVEVFSVDPSADDEHKIVLVSELNPYAPAARWLHASASVIGSDMCFVHGGQAYGSVFSDAFTISVTAKTPWDNPSICCERVEFVGDSLSDDQHSGDSIPGARAGHTLVYDGVKKVFVLFGGSQASDSCSNDCFAIRLLDRGTAAQKYASCKRIECSGDKPSPRWCHSAVISNRNMIVFGGWSIITSNNSDTLSTGDNPLDREDIFLNDVYALNLETYTWTKMHTYGTAPSPRCQAAVFAVGSDDTFFSDHIDSIAWDVSNLSVKNEISVGSGGYSGCEGYLVVYGGNGEHEQPPLDEDNVGILKLDLHDFKVLDLDTHNWLPVSYSFPRSRGGGNAVTQIAPGQWLLSGGMHTSNRNSLPRFKNDILLVIPNVGKGKGSFELKLSSLAKRREAEGDAIPATSPDGSVDISSKIFHAKI